MILLRFVCAFAVVGACRGDPALHPDSPQGPNHHLHGNPHFDVYNNMRYDMYRNPQYDLQNNFNNGLNRGLQRASPFGFHDSRRVPSYVSQRAPAVSVHHAPAVSTFNAPAVSSLRGSAVFPDPYIVPPNVHNVHPHHDSLNTVYKTPLPYARPVPQPKPVIPIKSQYHVQDGLGQYSFGYDAGISTRQESRDAYGNVRGSFSYIDSNGKLQTQHYTAGKGGFQVRGTNLPVHVTNEGRHKRSYATFPAATGPLYPVHHSQNHISATPYHAYGPPRQSFSYTLQSFPSTPSRIYYPDLPRNPPRGYYY